jgi:YVTN family beta-propeller protein
MRLRSAFAAAVSLCAAFVHAAPFAYIPNNDGTVSVIDTATNTVVKTIPVGNGPVGVAVNPKGTMVYTTNDIDGSVSVIDAVTNMVTATIKVGREPDFIAVHPTLPVAYVSNHADNNVSVINTNTNLVTATIPVGVLPGGVVVDHAGTFAYVANNGVSDSVSVVDTATNMVVATIPAGGSPTSGPYGIAINGNNTRLYTARPGGNALVVIDTATRAVVATVAVGSKPTNVAVNPTKPRVYVTNTFGDTVSVIDTGTNTVVQTVPVGPTPAGIAVNPAGTFVYVANSGSNTVWVIDAATNTVTTKITVGMGPEAQGLFIGPAALSNAPIITTAASATFTVGMPGSFQVIATGNPTPMLTESGALPPGLTFTTATSVATAQPVMDERALPNGTVIGTISGTPVAGSAGIYHITFTATNGVPPDATQSFALTVNPIADIPGLGPWMLALLALLLVGLTAHAFRNRSPR